MILLDSTLLLAERPAKARSGAIVTSGKMGWRFVVPVAVKGECPRQVTEQLDKIGRIRIEADATGVGQGRKNIRSDVQVGFAELKQTQIRGNQCSGHVLCWPRNAGLMIIRALPSQSAHNTDPRTGGVLQKASKARAKRRLKSDALHRALQKVTYASVEVIFPPQEVIGTKCEIVSSGRG